MITRVIRPALLFLVPALAAALLAACGQPAPVEKVAKAPGNFLAGIDEDTAHPEREGFRRKEILSRGYRLKPHDVNIHTEPFRVTPFNREEDVWITNWRSNTESPTGEREPDDIHCHALFSMDPVLADDVQDFRGLFTDGFTPVIELPEGFAIRVRKNERMMFQPMFNNRRPDSRIARMRLIVDYVPDSKKPRSYTELRATVLRVSPLDLYWVDPGAIDRKVRVIAAPFQGRIHAIAAHLHPYGELVEMERVSDGKVIASCRMHHARALADERLDVLRFPEGIFVRRGEKLRITTVYNNTTDEKIDAMGGLYVLYDPNGKPDA